MNYLAHAYLSFGIPEITLGNLISDFVKGKKKNDYPAAIQRGIMLHRAIDTFTDTLIRPDGLNLFSEMPMAYMQDH
jgi:acyl carrier protein phosphodiesterase